MVKDYFTDCKLQNFFYPPQNIFARKLLKNVIFSKKQTLLRGYLIILKSNRYVISHFCTNKTQSSENLACKNVEIYLWDYDGAKNNLAAK